MGRILSELIIWTYDWVPEGPRGFVRDLQAEVGLRGSRACLFGANRPVRRAGDQSPVAPALRPGSVPERWRSGNVRERCRAAASGPEERKADAARSGRRSGNGSMDDRRAQLDRDGHRSLVVPRNLRREGQRSCRLDGKPPRPSREGPQRAGMAGGRSLHRRGSADGGCPPRPESPRFRRSAGDRGLCGPRHRPPRVQEGARRSIGAFRRRRRRLPLPSIGRLRHLARLLRAPQQQPAGDDQGGAAEGRQIGRGAEPAQPSAAATSSWT